MIIKAQAVHTLEMADKYGRQIGGVPERIADALAADISDRRGLKHEWGQIDEEVISDILDVWAEIVRQAIPTGIGTFKDPLPWRMPEFEGWSIVGMNHYHIDGVKRIFISMAKDGRCIKAEGPDDEMTWLDLACKAL